MAMEKMCLQSMLICVLLTCLYSVFGTSVPIIRKYGRMVPYVNQTSYGYFRRVTGSQEVVRLPSIWMQDDSHKRMRTDVGRRGEPGFIAELYFFQNVTYEVRFDSKLNAMTCKKVPDFNYSMELSTYGEPNFGFLGRHILQEYNNVTADVYVGQAVDGVGQMNCMVYMNDEATKFLGLVVVGVANKFSFLDYWFGDNLTTTVPPDSWFMLPAECNNPHEERFFDVHNADGSLKQETQTSSAGDFCSPQKNNRVSMVLYRSVCCGLQSVCRQLGNGGTQ